MAPNLTQDVPESFRTALASLKSPRVPSEVKLTEVPAPSRLAPYSLALSAEVFPSQIADTPLAAGRFVVLHDPEGQVAWDGEFRAVTLARAELEPDIGHDPLLPGVAWSWVEENVGPISEARALGGTITAIASESFGALGDQDSSVELEIRASWTTGPDLSAHLAGWAQMLCVVAGIPPVPEGVSQI